MSLVFFACSDGENQQDTDEDTYTIQSDGEASKPRGTIDFTLDGKRYTFGEASYQTVEDKLYLLTARGQYQDQKTEINLIFSAVKEPTTLTLTENSKDFKAAFRIFTDSINYGYEATRRRGACEIKVTEYTGDQVLKGDFTAEMLAPQPERQMPGLERVRIEGSFEAPPF